MGKAGEDLTGVINKLDPADRHRMLHPAKLEFAFFRRTWNIYQKASPNFTLEIVQSMFSDCSGIKTQLNSRVEQEILNRLGTHTLLNN